MKTEISVDSKHQTLQGLAFPLRESAKRALQQLAQKRINYIQLVSLNPQHRVGLVPQSTHEPDLFCRVVFQRLDVEKETIELVHSNPTETCDLPRSVPKDTPRYHLFLYKHSHEGDYLESVGMSLIICSAKRARVHSEAHIWSPDIERGAHALSSLGLLSNTGFTVNKLSALQRSVLLFWILSSFIRIYLRQ